MNLHGEHVYVCLKMVDVKSRDAKRVMYLKNLKKKRAAVAPSSAILSTAFGI